MAYKSICYKFAARPEKGLTEKTIKTDKNRLPFNKIAKFYG